MFVAEETRARGHNMTEHRFGLFDPTNAGEKLGLDEHGVERTLRLRAMARSCDVHGIGSEWKSFFDPAHVGERGAHACVEVRAIHHMAQGQPRSESRQNLECVARSTRLSESASPHNF
mmetsp:Transcript_25287/g.100792  ORF Transcript_25287/g.100792 Transcript_25287/m.100792 type:complete len:118 (-) Transcript_25287:309-662(-)